MTKTPVYDLESLKHSAIDNKRFLELVLEDRIPDPLIGWMTVTMCLRFLRAVFGTSNEQVPYALLQCLDEWKEEMDEMDEGGER